MTKENDISDVPTDAAPRGATSDPRIDKFDEVMGDLHAVLLDAFGERSGLVVMYSADNRMLVHVAGSEPVIAAMTKEFIKKLEIAALKGRIEELEKSP
jgi:hypothetical protein